MLSCKFREISHNTFIKEPFGRLLLHKHSFCLLSHPDFLPFQKRCHIYFPAEYFLGLIGNWEQEWSQYNLRNTFLQLLLFTDSLLTKTATSFLIPNFNNNIFVCRNSHAIKCFKKFRYIQRVHSSKFDLGKSSCR